MPTAAERALAYAREAGTWNPSFCLRAGALADIEEMFVATAQSHAMARAQCWFRARAAWDQHAALLSQAWSLEADAGQEAPSEEALQRVHALCEGVPGGWATQLVVLDVPKYVHDLRGCGRNRRNLWRLIEHVHHRLQASIFAVRRGVHVCLPAGGCSPAELASGPVPLWLAHVFDVHEALYHLPPPRPDHANSSAAAARGGWPLGGAGRPAVCQPRDPEGWVHIRASGRLGNLLLDLANGLAIALRTGRRGVFFEVGHAGPAAASSAANSLFGPLLGVGIEVPPEVREDQRLQAAVARLKTRCNWDGRLATLAQVTVATYWSAAPMESHCGSLQSCALPLALRRQLLRAALLPRLRATGACSSGRGVASDGAARHPGEAVLTIHLRGGDAVPAGTPEHAQPPCSAYDVALEDARFQYVKVVAEDARNPCFAYLAQRYAPRLVEARAGGSLVGDICDLLSARALFLAVSSLDASLVLLGEAAHILVPLPSEAFSPGLVTFGFTATRYLAELCEVFRGAVTGLKFGYSYYVTEGVGTWGLEEGDAPVFNFAGVSAAHTLGYPADGVTLQPCPP